MTPVSEILKRLQFELGITSAKLVKDSGLSMSMVTKIRTGERTNPSRETIAAMAEALGVEPEVFFE